MKFLGIPHKQDQQKSYSQIAFALLHLEKLNPEAVHLEAVPANFPIILHN